MARSVGRPGLPLAVAIVAVLAVGMTAATLTTAVTADGGVSTFVPKTAQDLVGERIQGSQGPGGNITGGDGDWSVQSGVSLQFCVDFLNSAAGALAVFGSFTAVVGAVYRRFSAPVALLAGWILLSPTLLFYFLFTNCASGDTIGDRIDSVPGPDVVAPLLPADAVPPWLLGLVVGGVLVMAAGVLIRSLGEDRGPALEERSVGEDGDDPDLDAFAAAARRAADRIERHDAPVDNAVYRAWVEMTGLLDVERPEVYTPGEFADAAIRLGMAGDDVDELTRLFEEVRYGGRAPEGREDRALAVLRRIERAYGPVAEADGDSDPGPGGTGEIRDDR